MTTSNAFIFRPITALLLGLLSVSTLAAPAPTNIGKAEQLRPLADGGWLVQDKKQLRRLDAQGREQAKLEIKSQQLDVRADRAVLVEYVSQQVQVLDLAQAGLKRLTAVPPTRFAVDALCLYRDPQQLIHAFLIGEEGQAEQWLLSGPAPQKVRDLALPSNVVDCQVDDRTQQLLVVEEDFGVWAYPADAERKFVRQAVQLRQPHGKLQGGAQQIALLTGGVAILDQAGKSLHLLQHGAKGWKLRQSLPQQQARKGVSVGGGQLWLRDAKQSTWQAIAAASFAPTPVAAPFPIVLPQVQTDPVAKLGDAADDPAIWVHPSDASRSRVLGTNKKQGLLVYDMQGKELQLLTVGRVNNVDVRQNVRFGSQTLDLAVATQRDDQSLIVFGIAADGTVSERARIPTTQKDIYGVCLYQPVDGGLEAFANDKDGSFFHYRFALQGDVLQGSLLRRFSVSGQPEGCVANDAEGILYFGEEARGVWVTSARAAAPTTPKLILQVGQGIEADVEGIALYHGAKHRYVVVSSQGNDAYVVLDAEPPYRHRGAFRIGIHAERGIDAASETDGLEVTSANLGGVWQQGMLVVQDGHKRLPDGAQNFKYVAWADIAKALNLE